MYPHIKFKEITLHVILSASYTYLIRIGFHLLIICMDMYFVRIYYRYICVYYLCRMSIYLQYHEDDNNKGRGNERKCRSITHDQIDI